MLTHGARGFFGKIPSQGDFVRLNVGEPAAGALVRWLEDSNETLHRAGAGHPPDPLAFLFRAPGSLGALMGVLGRGLDKVGRPFPSAVFAAVQGNELAEAFPLFPALYQGFVRAATAILGEAPALTAAQLADRVRSLPLPGPGEMADSQARALRARDERAREMQQRLFGEPASGRQYYAFRTFRSACDPVRGRDPGKVNLALDCPCRAEADRYAWLELARRTLGWPTPPPFFWSAGTQVSLLLSLGAVPPSLLAYLSDPRRDSPRIWPLQTEQPQAIAAARKALPAAHLSALDGEGTVEELVAALSR